MQKVLDKEYISLNFLNFWLGHWAWVRGDSQGVCHMGANPWPYVPPFQSPAEVPISQTELEPSGQGAHWRDPCAQVLAQSMMGRGRASSRSCPKLELVSGAPTTAALTCIHQAFPIRQALCSALRDTINLTTQALDVSPAFLTRKLKQRQGKYFPYN